MVAHFCRYDGSQTIAGNTQGRRGVNRSLHRTLAHGDSAAGHGMEPLRRVGPRARQQSPLGFYLYDRAANLVRQAWNRNGKQMSPHTMAFAWSSCWDAIGAFLPVSGLPHTLKLNLRMFRSH